MEISAEMVKKLRELTGVGFMECKAALQEAKGDLEAAVTILRKKGLASLAKKAGRETKDGLVGAYIHNGKIGVMVEVNCETDFVARSAAFRKFAHEVALQIAAGAPKWVKVEDIPAEVLDEERQKARNVALAEGKAEKETPVYERQDFWASTSNNSSGVTARKTALTEKMPNALDPSPMTNSSGGTRQASTSFG